MPTGYSEPIYVHDLVKIYDGDIRAVDGLEFTVHKGEIYGLLGKNGAGKTTTIRILTTLIPPTSGEALVCGLDVRHRARKIRELIGVVQQGEAFDFTTVEGNFRIYQMLWKMPRREAAEKTEMLMELFNISHLRKKRMFELSGGEKKRVQVAREFLHDMDVLFLDEPTVGMDPIMRRSVLDFIRKKAKEGLTVLFTTQILEEADYLCDRIGIMNHGKISAEGSASYLKNTYGEMRKVEIVLETDLTDELKKNIEVYLSQFDSIHTFQVGDRRIEMILRNMGKVLPQFIQYMNRISVEIETINSDNPSLDDVFLEVVKG